MTAAPDSGHAASNSLAQHPEIEPLETLYDASHAAALPLPPALEQFYGALRFPLRTGAPYILANLVTSLDGVVSLGIPGRAGGKEISGSSLQDRALMGLLRAAADAVVVGAGTLRESNGRPLTAAAVYPPLSEAYSAFRASLGKQDQPVAVIVTASGDLDPAMPVFSGPGTALVVTTPEGARRAGKSGLRDVARVVEVKRSGSRRGGGEHGSIPARAVLDAVMSVRDCPVLLVEGGPHLLGTFFAEGLVDEQFLTLSPQIMGRDASGERLSLVEGHTFAPAHPLWGTLSVVKRGASHLFLRYLFHV